MSCTSPIPFETLVELWTGELPAEQADAVDTHLFSCDACAAASERLGALVTGLRDALPPVISHAHRDRLVARGTRIRLTPVDAGTPADATFEPGVDLLVHVLRADLAGVEQVDLEIVDVATGKPFASLVHVPFDASRGEVLVACQRHYADSFPKDPSFRVTGVAAGQRRELGEYRVLHHFV